MQTPKGLYGFELQVMLGRTCILDSFRLLLINLHHETGGWVLDYYHELPFLLASPLLGQCGPAVHGRVITSKLSIQITNHICSLIWTMLRRAIAVVRICTQKSPLNTTNTTVQSHMSLTCS